MAKMACASHILLGTEKQADVIKNKLDKGENFAQLAKQHSKCPSSKKGGDLGEFRKGGWLLSLIKPCSQMVAKTRNILGQ